MPGGFVLGGCGLKPADSGFRRDKDREITVISREEGSGTRTAFVSRLGISRGGHDRTAVSAEVTQSTAVMLLSVQRDRGAIGYVSAMTPRERVRTVKVNGVLPSAASIRDGSYPLRQHFYLVMRMQEKGSGAQEQSEAAGAWEEDAARRAAQEFAIFVMSLRGQTITAQAGYVPMKASLEAGAAAREAAAARKKAAGAMGGGAPRKTAQGRTRAGAVPLVIAGSTAMAPLMQTLAAAYQEMRPEVAVEIQQNGSAAGITAVLEGACEIGMSSRALTEAELARGIQAVCIAADGIAVIVNPDNPVQDLSTEVLRGIYCGEIRRWENVVNLR